MSEGGRAVRIQLLIGFMCVALIAYFFLLWRIAWAFISSGEAAAVGLGLALMILPFIGLWVLVATLRAGLAHQRLGRIIRDEGLELDVSALGGQRSVDLLQEPPHVPFQPPVIPARRDRLHMEDSFPSCLQR